MSSDERKLDSGMSAAYRAWRDHPDLSPNAGISVSLSFTGDLAEIEALGFETHGVLDDQAFGMVRFKDVPALSEHPGVQWIAAGRAPKADLDTAAMDIGARATLLSSGSPLNGVWHADIATGVLTAGTNATGKGVIVAIIDTGIDYTHPMFIVPGSSPRKTRIRRIWDQGLTPAAVSDCPPVQLLASAHTYGVEYDRHEIDAALNGGTPLAHRDCDGHGTHVAGIAAGGTNFPLFGDASKVGIAPEADIIAVKLLDNPDKLFYRLTDGTVGPEVSEAMKFRDAILYCLRTARDVFNDQPVVINLSFGYLEHPGDALDDEARFLDALLDPKASAGSFHFPKRAVVVKSMGNEGNQRSQRVGRIEVPPSTTIPTSGEIVVPFELLDERKGTQTRWQHCANEVYKPPLSLHFWYRAPAPQDDRVKFAVRSPFGSAFSADVGPNSTLALGVKSVVGPPRRDDPVAPASNVHRITIEHKDVPGVRHPKTQQIVKRNYVHIFVSPKESGGAFSYHTGIYEVRIKAPIGTVIFVQGELVMWNGEAGALFHMNDKMQNGIDRHANIVSLAESSAVSPMAQHVITVANYTDTGDPAQFVAPHSIDPQSSRGPIRDYSDPPQPPSPFCAKPDIAAPGTKINSARSIHTEPLTRWLWWWRGERFEELSGTSMAAPMVAGVVALLLQRKPDLNVQEVRDALFFAPGAAVEPSTPPDSTNAYGVGRVNALSSHNNV